ncbi:MAG: PAS domain-containing protein, partial [Deltaproteobacteria bacterium]
DTELPLQRAVSENRDIPPTELEIELPSGRRWFAEASAAPLRDRQRNVVGGVAVTVDVTARKRAEEALRRAKEDWEQTFNTVPDLIAILDSDHRIIRVNKAMADRLGVAPEQCIGKSCYDAVHRSGSPPAFCPHALTCRDGEERLAEVHEPRLGGDFVVSTTPMFGERGQVVGAVHVAREITERKRNEARLLSISRRFALLADTAGELLTAQEPQQAMEALCRRVMEHLDCQVFFNFLVDEKSGRLRLNACAGILEEEARAIEWMEYGTAICGCVAREGQCIVAQRIGDTPDPRTELVKSYGVRAYACHPLLGPAGKVLGTLSFGTRTRETLSDEDLSLMRAVTDHVAAAMTRVRSEEALRFSLAEKEILLKELAHRTKNNMQVIGSLIALQASGSTDETLLGALSDTQDRIRAMALVHEKLYHSGNVSSLNMNEYVRDLVSSLLHAHQGPAGPVTAELDVDDLRFSIDEALPCGLIINELVSNSVKHAFPGRRPGTAFLSLKRKDAGVELRYRDDGPGLPADIDPARVRSLGLKLVYNLAVRQLRGKMEVRRESATEFVFAFDGPARQEKA